MESGGVESGGVDAEAPGCIGGIGRRKVKTNVHLKALNKSMLSQL
jgi:hypothetical protein